MEKIDQWEHLWPLILSYLTLATGGNGQRLDGCRLAEHLIASATCWHIPRTEQTYRKEAARERSPPGTSRY